MLEHSEFTSDVSEDIRGDIFTCDVPGKKKKKKKVSEELLNISTTQQQGVKLALGYICKTQMSSVNEK